MGSTLTTLDERVRQLSWYHTLELAPGVVTPGFFDTRPTVGKVPLPGRLDGTRCLDVGTWDGFWAFEMERRGADSVTAIDIEDPTRWDWPPHTQFGPAAADRLAYLSQFKSGAASFALAKEALGSSVERIDRSVYELDPAVDGTFDFVFLGSLLLHLRDPIRALDRLRAVCSGEAVIAETVELIPSILRPRTPSARLEGVDQSWWWQPNVAAFRRMVTSAGFEIVERTGIYMLPTGPAHPRPPWFSGWRDVLTARGREKLVI
ncbi:MAG TPA: methyltransferase domain-containing protein, partial [Solirubrobacteraceae bacterium]